VPQFITRIAVKFIIRLLSSQCGEKSESSSKLATGGAGVKLHTEALAQAE